MILDIALVVCSLVLAINLFLNIVGSSFYTTAEIKKSRLRYSHQSKYRKKPIVSVIVRVSSPDSDISACLKSLFTSRYPKLDIIVIDVSSTTTIKKVVQVIITGNPKQQIRFIRKPKLNSQIDVLRYTAQLAKGEVVLSLSSSGSTINKDAIKKAVMCFNERSDLGILLVNETSSESHTIAGVYRSYGQRIANVSLKAQCFLRATYFIDYESSAFYRTALLKNIRDLERFKAPKNTKVAFSTEIITRSAPVSLMSLLRHTLNRQRSLAKAIFGIKPSRVTTDSKILLWPLVQAIVEFILNLVYLCLPIILGYFTYLAVSLKEPDFLEVSLVLFFMYLIFAIYQDEQSTIGHKVLSIFLSPVYISWLCLVSILRYLTLTIIGFEALSYGWSKF